MGKRYELKTGDRVDLYLDGSHRATVETMSDEKTVIVTIPHEQGATPLREKQSIKLYYYRETGRYCVDARILRMVIREGADAAVIEMCSMPRREQRRLAFRVPARLRTTVYLPMDDSATAAQSGFGTQMETATTRDISETGVLLATRDTYQIGDELMLEIYLPYLAKQQHRIKVKAKVRRECYDELTETKRFGMEFIAISPQDKELLSKFVSTQQNRLLQQEQLLQEQLLSGENIAKQTETTTEDRQ